jgi:Phosphotransferase enzyme family
VNFDSILESLRNYRLRNERFDQLISAFTANKRTSEARKLSQPHGRQLSGPATAQAQDRSARARVEHFASAEPFPADPSMPQLEAATDLEVMRDAFQKHRRFLSEKACQVQECQISYIRYLPAKRCMLQYTLRLTEPDTGREWNQWVTGWIYAEGRTRRRWEKLRRSVPHPEIAEASLTLEPFFYLPDPEMLVQMFPYDRSLSILPLLMTSPASELEPLLLPQFGVGDWRAEAWKVEPVKYWPQIRAILRLTVRARDAAAGSRVKDKRFYAKVYKNGEKGERTYQVLRMLWDKASAGDIEFIVGRPITYLRGLRTLIQEEVPGTTLEDLLLQYEDKASLAVCKVARILATLHLSHEARLQCYPLDDVAADFRAMMNPLQQACPHLKSKMEEIIYAVAVNSKEIPLTPTHGDLNSRNIILDGEHIALLDFDDFAEGDPVLDAARLLADLATMSLRSPLSRSRAQETARAFAEEYFAHVPEAWRARLPVCYARSILEVCVSLFWKQGPCWVDKIEALVEEAKDSLLYRVW